MTLLLRRARLVGAGDELVDVLVREGRVAALAPRVEADAATEVKDKVTSASTHVRTGVDLVDQTGQALSRIIDSVAEVSGSIDEIARSSDNQAKSLGQINVAIGEMDRMTQENAAMVEQTSAAAHLLVAEAQQLAASIATFEIDGEGAGAVPLRQADRSEHQNASEPLRLVSAGGR